MPGYYMYVLLKSDSFFATFRLNEDMEKEKMMMEMQREEGEEAGALVAEKSIAPQQNVGQKIVDCYETYVEGVRGTWFEVPKKYEKLTYKERDAIPVAQLKRGLRRKDSSYFFMRYSGAFDYYNGRWHWFMCAEIFACMLLGLCDGLISAISCKNVIYILVAMYSVYVLAVFGIRPFCTRKDFFFMGTVTLLQFVGAICTILPESTMSKEDMEKNVTLVSSAALIVATVQAAEGILANGGKLIVEKLTKEEDHDLPPEDDEDENAVPLVEKPSAAAAAAADVPVVASPASSSGVAAASPILQTPTPQVPPPPPPPPAPAAAGAPTFGSPAPAATPAGNTVQYQPMLVSPSMGNVRPGADRYSESDDL